MALWGNKDSKSVAGTIAVTNGSKNVVGTGTSFTSLKTGQTLVIASVPYKIGSITDATHLTLIKDYAGSTASGLTVTANESPVFANGAKPYPSQPYGVSQSEQEYGGDKILSVTLVGGGSGYVEAPVPVVTVGSSAAFTVSISGGAVTGIAVSDSGSGYTRASTITIPKARVTIPISGVTTATDTVAFTGHGLAAADEIIYNNGGGASATGLTSGTSYFVSAAGRTANAFKVATTAQAAAGRDLSTVAVSGTAGQLTCAAATLAVGDRVVATGTLTGDETGVVAATVYKVSAVTGSSPNVTGFTLTTEAGGALTTTAGTTTGLAFKAYTVVDISGTGNNDQYFEKVASTAATAALVFGPGNATLKSTQVSAPGWVVVKSGTGGRAGRRTFETLAVVKNISGDASDDTVFPEA